MEDNTLHEEKKLIIFLEAKNKYIYKKHDTRHSTD